MRRARSRVYRSSCRTSAIPDSISTESSCCRSPNLIPNATKVGKTVRSGNISITSYSFRVSGRQESWRVRANFCDLQLLLRLFFPRQLQGQQDIDKVVIPRLNKGRYRGQDGVDENQKSDGPLRIQLALP